MIGVECFSETPLKEIVRNDPIKETKERSDEFWIKSKRKDIAKMQKDLSSLKREFDEQNIKMDAKIQSIMIEVGRLTKSFARVYGKKL